MGINCTEEFLKKKTYLRGEQEMINKMSQSHSCFHVKSCRKLALQKVGVWITTLLSLGTQHIFAEIWLRCTDAGVSYFFKCHGKQSMQFFPLKRLSYYVLYSGLTSLFFAHLLFQRTLWVGLHMPQQLQNDVIIAHYYFEQELSGRKKCISWVHA